MDYVELTAINWRNEQRPNTPQLSVVGEDDLEQPVEGETEPREAGTYPVTINLADVREFYPRHGWRVGTRLVFKNGAARPVKETYAEVQAKVVAALNGGQS